MAPIAFGRHVGKNYKMVVRSTPAQKAERRRQLEANQVVDRPIIMMSRHNFEPRLTFSAHQRHDPILQVAYSILRDFCYSSFANWCNPLEIEPLFSDDAVFLHQAMAYGAPACAMYVIGRYGMLAKVRLFMHAWNGQVFVQDQEKFIELSEWLKTLPPPAGSVKGKKGCEMLLSYWADKGQTFEIMKLPAELWTYIFELAFGMDVYPSHDSQLGNGSHSEKDMPKHLRYTHRNIKIVPPPTKSVMSLNKTIYDAVHSLVLNNTCKCFNSASRLQRYVVQEPSNELVLSNLRILELDFSNAQYFYFFGVQVAPFINNLDRIQNASTVSAGDILPKLANLNHLFLRFQVPPDGDKDPWFNTGKYNGHANDRWISDFQGNTSHWMIGCQKVVVDWILTFAKQYIQRIPLVTLTGCIKNSTKAKWEQVLRDERKSRDREVHDMSGMKEVIMHWDLADLAPSCHCSKKCGRTWFKETSRSNRKVYGNRVPYRFDRRD